MNYYSTELSRKYLDTQSGEALSASDQLVNLSWGGDFCELMGSQSITGAVKLHSSAAAAASLFTCTLPVSVRYSQESQVQQEGKNSSVVLLVTLRLSLWSDV